MRTFLYCAVMFLVMIVVPLTASAQFPTPKPKAAPVETVQPAPAPAPVVVAPAPTAPVAAPAGWTQDDILKWIWTALGTIAAAIFGKNSFWPSASAPAVPSPAKTVSEVLAGIKDPAKRREMDEYMLQIVQTGIPGELVKAGLGAIPVAGPFAAQLEPMIRKIVSEKLAERAAGQ